MSLLGYLFWGYIILFALMAFLVYAACVMAARADKAESKHSQRHPAPSRRAAPVARPPTPAAEPPTLPPSAPERERSYT